MGERSYEVAVLVSAPAATVWSILGDVTNWPTWTPTVTSVRPRGDTRLAPGAVFEVKQPGIPEAVFTVESCVEGESFCWVSHSNGARSRADHVIEDRGTNQCMVRLEFTIESRAAGLVWLIAGRKVRRFVDLEAQSLKAAAEANVT